jgi:hypothetical protein
MMNELKKHEKNGEKVFLFSRTWISTSHRTAQYGFHVARPN